MELIVTPKQTDFIRDLLAARVVPADLREKAGKVATRFEASVVIDALLRLPRRAPGTAFAEDPARVEYRELLAEAVVSKYAVPTAGLRLAIPGFDLKGDLLFIEIRNYAGKRYLNRLVGAPGAFSRYRLPLNWANGLLRYINGRHVEFAKLFSEHYSVCGRCAAELTDQHSRETGFGPECRRVFGIA